MIKVCEHCGREFKADTSAKFCDDCRTFHCEVCGKECHPKGAQLRRAWERGYAFCSRLCANIYNGHRRSPEAREQTSRMARDPEVIAKRKATFMERYGVETPMEIPEVRRRALDPDAKRIALAKARRTLMKRYGVSCALDLPHSRERQKGSNHTPEAEAKRRATNLERYGVDNPFKLPGVNERAVWNAHTDEANRKRSESLKRAWAERKDEILAKRDATKARKKLIDSG